MNKKQFYINQGNELRKMRKRLGLSLSDVGALLGVTHQQIAKYETGLNKMSTYDLIKFCDVLSVPISVFLSTEDKDGE